MKKLLLLGLGILLLTSCEFTEKVYIDENGDVSFSSHIDLTSLLTLSQENLHEELPIDTIFTYDQMLNSDTDILPEQFKSVDKEEEEMMKDFMIHLKMDENTGFMSIFLKNQKMSDFNSHMQYLSESVDRINAERALKSSDSTASHPDIELPILSLPKLTYDGKSFSRKGKIEKFNQIQNEEIDELSSLIKFNVEYHFPKPVQWVSDESIKMSADRKTIYLEKPMRSIMDNPNAYDFEVKF